MVHQEIENIQTAAQTQKGDKKRAGKDERNGAKVGRWDLTTLGIQP